MNSQLRRNLVFNTAGSLLFYVCQAAMNLLVTALAGAAANGLLGKAVPSFIGVEPISIDRENLLKNWKAIFKEDPPAALRNAINRSTGAL